MVRLAPVLALAVFALCAATAAPAHAEDWIVIDNTKVTVPPRDSNPTLARRLDIGPYVNSTGQLEPASPWKYVLRTSSETMNIVDDGDGKEDTKLGRVEEGLGDEPNENCSYHKVNGVGGAGNNHHTNWTVVRCKVLTTIDDPGNPGVDDISMQLQKDAPKLTADVLGGPGADVIEIGPRVSGVVDGGEGDQDELHVESRAETLDWVVDLLAGTAVSSGQDQFQAGGFEHFDGGTANSDDVSGHFSPDYTVAGTNGPNRITTTGGDDEIAAGAGDDVIETKGFWHYGSPTDADDIDAGPGHDEVVGGFGADSITGGTGDDRIESPGGADTIDAGPGDDFVEVGQQTLADVDGDGVNDQVAADVDVRGGDGKDTIERSFWVDETKPVGRFLVDGGDGDDTIRTSAGDDTIRGGPGNDTIDCGPGDDSVADVEPGDKLTNCEGRLEVLLTTADVPNSDLFAVTVELFNTTQEHVTGVLPKAGVGLVQVPDVFAVADQGAVVPMGDSGELYPGALGPGERFRRTFTFLTIKPGRVLLQAEVEGLRADGSRTRDAEYADVGISSEADAVTETLEKMGAIEGFSTDAHNAAIRSSREWAAERVKLLRSKLPAKAEKRWLGTSKGGARITRLDEAMSHLHGMSPEEIATAVPRGDVVRKGGQRRIDAARRAVLNADSGKETKQAKQRLRRVRAAQTLTSSESMAVYNKARMQSDGEELWKIYDEYAEKPAKELAKAGGGVFRYLLQTGSYAGRQQIEADLIRFAELNEQSMKEAWWVWSSPGESYTAVTEGFRQNVEEAEVLRAKREQLKRDYYLTDPAKAIQMKAADDSWYAAQVLRYFIDEFQPSPSAKLLDKEITWGGKVARSKTARASVVMAEAVKRGDAAVGREVFNAAEDLGEGVRHADDFLFPSADPKDLLKLDQIGKQGGAGIRDQRIAEQINREVTEDLRREFAGVDIEFNMYYRPKKDYDPLGSLPKAQAFGEKTLDPRSIEILGAPAEGLGKLVIFKPDHPASKKGWAALSSVEKKGDLDLYKLHLDQWVNFNKRNPAGKTGQWKPALDKKTKIDFGGGHSVEIKLEQKKLGKNAVEIRATEMHIDGTQVHKGKPASFGGDLDPLMALNAKTGKKLEGEVERRALVLWNQKAVKAQKELGFRSGGHGATAHGDDVTPAQWAKFAKYAAVHMTPDEQLVFEALVVARAGLPAGTKVLPAGLPANEHLVKTTTSDTWLGPLGTVLD